MLRRQGSASPVRPTSNKGQGSVIINNLPRCDRGRRFLSLPNRLTEDQRQKRSLKRTKSYDSESPSYYPKVNFFYLFISVRNLPDS